MDVRRVHPTEHPNAVAVEQLAALLKRLPPSEQAPLFVFDAGSDPLPLPQALAADRADLLVRLRSDRCFYADPPVAVPSPAGGRPRTHGAKFACKDPRTWPTPAAEHVAEDGTYGAVRVRAWTGRHPKQQTRPDRGSRRPRPIVRGTLVLVEVGRLPRQTREPRAPWLWWHGSGSPDLDVLWRAYVHRFDVEHTPRFRKQTLGWTTPRPRHPEQADRWTWLVVAASTQPRLARTRVADRRLPWERRLPPGKRTPNRVRRDFPRLLTVLGSPASVPKPCGRSPGRPAVNRAEPPGTPRSKRPSEPLAASRHPVPLRSEGSTRLSMG